MRVYVESFTERTAAERVAAPRYDGREEHVRGGKGSHVEIVVHAVCESAEDAAAWKEAVGATLHVYAETRPE